MQIIGIEHNGCSTVVTIEHGNYTWEINRFPWGYRIYGWSRYDEDKGFSTNDDDASLTEAWYKAERLQKASDEFVEAGRRIAEKYDVDFIDNLVCNVAAHYWYLEG